LWGRRGVLGGWGKRERRGVYGLVTEGSLDARRWLDMIYQGFEALFGDCCRLSFLDNGIIQGMVCLLMLR